MKILFVTPYITSDRHPVFTRNRTGFGMMVYDIANYVGAKEKVDLLPVNAWTPPMELNNFKTIGQSLSSVLLHFNLGSLIESIRFLNRYSLPLKDKLRTIYQHLSVGAMSKRLGDYDIVHVHGCGPITNAVINLCKRKNKPFCVTLHGLVSFEDAVKLHPSLKRYEKDFLVEAYENDYAVSFISTGNYEQAIEYAKSQISK